VQDYNFPVVKILVIGPPLAGKTTLCRQLAEKSVIRAQIMSCPLATLVGDSAL
jgi:GTPase SAR1 family protein